MADEPTSGGASEFARAARSRGPGYLTEFWQFARHNKRWWVTPIIVILLLKDQQHGKGVATDAYLRQFALD